MPRFRELGFSVGTLPTGTLNAITDVAGVQVGHTTLHQAPFIHTGITAVLPHGENSFTAKVPAAVFTINGYGKATGFEQVRELGRIETPIVLTNTLCVGRVWDAVVTYMLDANPDLRSVNPIVGECNDGFLNDIRGRHITEAHVLAALANARAGAVLEGNVGAGAGTLCFGWKGGIGTSSRQIAAGYTVGALLQTNFGAPSELTILGHPIGRWFSESTPHLPPAGSVMIVLATDAPLSALELQRLAQRASFGLARTGSVAHHGSGDFVIAFSTQQPYTSTAAALTPIQRVHDDLVNDLFTAVVESVEEAVYNALCAAETLSGWAGNTAYALPLDRVSAWLTTPPAKTTKK